jgi:DNA polymerase III epsilon subunit-like protein
MLLYFDLESNGFKNGPSVVSKYHRIVQFCVVNEQNEVFERVVNCGMRIPTESTAIHRITTEQSREGPTFADMWDEFLEQVERWMSAKRRKTDDSVHPTVYLVAHNCFGFDALLLKLEWERIHYVQPDWLKFVDTLPFFKDRFPLLLDRDPSTQPFNLGHLYEHFFQEPLEGAHDAKSDVLGLKRLVDETGFQFSASHTKDGRFCRNEDSILDIKFIGLQRAKNIEAHLQYELFRDEGYKTVGDFRTYFKDTPLHCIERFLRVDLRVFDDHQVLLILSQIVEKSVLELKNKFPFITSAFGRVPLGETSKHVLKGLGIRSRNQLRDHYIFECEENVERFKEFLKKTGVTNCGTCLRKLYINDSPALV